MWIKKSMPTIQGYESLGNTVRAKRWLNFRINELFCTENPVWEFRDEFKKREEVCRFVIEEFHYPFKRGKPCDDHYKNYFGSRSCHRLSMDYWSCAHETLRTLRLNQKKEGKRGKGFGDCEDTSILLTTLFEEKKWNVYECFGLVYRDEHLLGGHGWSIFEDEGEIWRLFESTLDKPPRYPDGYPEVDPDENSWKVGGLTYRAFLKFNRKEYHEWKEEKVSTYIDLPFEEKNRKKKFEAIRENWKLPASPLEEMNWLSRFRWRR